MKPLRNFLDRLEPLFTRGGRFEKFEALFEMVDTLFYSPPDVTLGSPHVRDGLDLKRVMITVVFAATPCALIGMWNVGFQANTAMASLGIEWLDGWRGSMLALLGAGYDPASVYDNFMHGLVYFLPIYVVTMAAGGFWEVLFASVRNHEVNEGFFVTSFLYALILPATTPLWQVALGISFGVVIGKEVFGGTGKNFLNPALVGRAFLYFAYPVQLSGDAVWVPVDGYTGATALAVSSIDGMSGIVTSGLTYSQAFIGQMQGSIGETSLAACLFGAAMLIYTKIASWRIIVSVFAGMIVPRIDIQRHGRRSADDGRALALAHRNWWLCLRCRFHGHRPRQRARYDARPRNLRLVDRPADLDHPRDQPGIPGRHHARDIARQYFRAPDRLLRHP